jgi:hypothetical protein
MSRNFQRADISVRYAIISIANYRSNAKYVVSDSRDTLFANLKVV